MCQAEVQNAGMQILAPVLSNPILTPAATTHGLPFLVTLIDESAKTQDKIGPEAPF